MSALAAAPLAVAATGALTGTATAASRKPGTEGSVIYIAGDSTAAVKAASAAPEAGWGMALPSFLADGVRVANHAVNGRSSKSFYEEGRLDSILAAIRPGDLLLVQFGHNDEKTDDPDRGTDPYTTYQDYLRRYVAGARAHGARPVLLTPLERRRFDAEGHARTTHGAYPDAMRALAAEDGLSVIDTQAASLAEWDRLGPDGTMPLFLHLAPGEHPNYPDGKADNTHFRPRGAIEAARMAARGLKKQRLLHPGTVRRLDESVPDNEVTWPQA